MTAKKQNNGTALMKIVEAIAITPEDAREVVRQYEAQARAKCPKATDDAIQKIVIDKIIQRYSKLAGASGGATSLVGVIPGLGTAVAAFGGGLADVSICMKLQVDMTMCLAIAINDQLSNEDAKQMSFIIALGSSLEKFASDSASKKVSKAAVKIVSEYLKGPMLQTIKQLYRKIGVIFTKKAAVKTIPFGVGVIIGTSASYLLTRYVGRLARDVLLLEVGAGEVKH